MERKIGRILKVLIPGKNEFEVMCSNQIEFQIQLENQVISMVMEQNEMTAQIHKDDIVKITIQTISGKEFVDIEKVLVVED